MGEHKERGEGRNRRRGNREKGRREGEEEVVERVYMKGEGG